MQVQCNLPSPRPPKKLSLLRLILISGAPANTNEPRVIKPLREPIDFYKGTAQSSVTALLLPWRRTISIRTRGPVIIISTRRLESGPNLSVLISVFYGQGPLFVQMGLRCENVRDTESGSQPILRSAA
jgi:hypothetical protein